MAYGSSPSTSTTDAIRLKVGDTGTTAILSDAEYTYFYAENGNNILLAAADAADAIAAKYARQVNQSHGDGSLSLAQLYEHYTALAERLRSENSRKSGMGSISAPSSVKQIRDSVKDNIPSRLLITDIQPQDYDTDDNNIQSPTV